MQPRELQNSIYPVNIISNENPNWKTYPSKGHPWGYESYCKLSSGLPKEIRRNTWKKRKASDNGSGDKEWRRSKGQTLHPRWSHFLPKLVATSDPRPQWWEHLLLSLFLISISPSATQAVRSPSSLAFHATDTTVHVVKKGPHTHSPVGYSTMRWSCPKITCYRFSRRLAPCWFAIWGVWLWDEVSLLCHDWLLVLKLCLQNSVVLASQVLWLQVSLRSTGLTCTLKIREALQQSLASERLLICGSESTWRGNSCGFRSAQVFL